ncbi:MAG: hypothetical protein H8D46_01150, partial [FCB group bacterium]|nr:hypothetical protein [FCB group bacterium]
AVSLKSDIEERTILHYFKEVKDLKFSQTTIEYSIRGQGIQDGVIELKSDVLAKNVLLAFDNVGAHFSDNYFDLKPGELKSITYHSDREIDNIQDSLQIRSIRDTYNERD